MEDKSSIYGIRAVLEAVRSGLSLDKVFVVQGLKGPLIKELELLLKQRNISTAYVPGEKLNKLSNKNHQGVVAYISPIVFHDLEALVAAAKEQENHPVFLLLDGITDVRNMGAIIRTAACTGVNGIILPAQGSAPITGDTVKTSAGGVFKVPLCKVAHIKDAVYHLQAEGIQVIAATEKARDQLFDMDLNGPIAVVMGSEDRGVNPSVLKIVDRQLRLPMYGEIGSLNVSVACGVVLYEILRQGK